MTQKVAAHAPGTFCWPELSTPDQAGAEQFYTSLFGWTVQKVPLGPDQHYTIFQKDGKDVAAGFVQQEEQKKQGIPPNWLSYVSVADVAQSADKAKQLGGTVLMGPFDVMDKGKMAVVQDPTGAVFAMWEAVSHPGAGVLDEVGALGWTELMTRGVDKAIAFYSKLLGWSTQTVPMGDFNYTLFLRGGTKAAGGMEIPAGMEQVPPHWMAYFQVADTDRTFARAKELKAEEIMPPTDIPNVGRFAILRDPQGAPFSILKYDPVAK